MKTKEKIKKEIELRHKSVLKALAEGNSLAYICATSQIRQLEWLLGDE